MLLLNERIKLLENDLKAFPMRISAYHDLPFAILRYDPDEEWTLRRELRLLMTRLQLAGKSCHTISLGELLWGTIERAEGVETLVEMEKSQGFQRAQSQVTMYLSDVDWYPLPEALAEQMNALDPEKSNPLKHIVFLTRAAAFAPAIYHLSKLLDEMQAKTAIPAILCFPGTLEGETGLRYMGLRDRESFGNYRVKIYG